MNNLYIYVLITLMCIATMGCITGKIKVTDTKTGNAVTLSEDGVAVYLETIDAGRFSVEQIDEPLFGEIK